MTQQRVARGPIAIGLVATVAMAASVVPPAGYGVLAPFIIDSLDISRTQFGLLITCFQVVGAVLATGAGILVDRFGPRRVMTWLYIASLVSVAIMVAPGTYLGLLIGASVAGLANASSNPATNRLVADSLLPGNQGTAIGIKQSGIQFTYSAFGALPVLAGVAGWRAALALAALIPLAGLATSRFVHTESVAPPRPPRQKTTGRRRSLPAGVWWLTTYALVLGIATASFSVYLVLYGVERLGLSPTTAGLAITLVGGLGVVSRIVAGRAAERAKHPSSGLALLAALAFIAIFLLLAAPHIGIGSYWLAAVFAGVSLASWNSVAMLGVITEVQVIDAGRASGVVLAGFLSGLTIGPLLFGYSVDVTGDYEFGWLFVALATIAALALALLWKSRSHPTAANRSRISE